MGDLFVTFLPSILFYLLEKLKKHTDVLASDRDAIIP